MLRLCARCNARPHVVRASYSNDERPGSQRARWPGRARTRPAARRIVAGILAAACGACGGPERAPRDPEVVVVVNRASAISRAIGRAYAEARDVPETRVVSIHVPVVDPTLTTREHETIARAHFERDVRDPIAAFLTERGLSGRPLILVTTKGVPLRIPPGPGESKRPFAEHTEASVDAELALLGSGLDGRGGTAAIPNPYLGADEPFAAWRRANPDAPLRHLVARLTGYQTDPDPETGVPRDVAALIERARGTGPPGVALVDEDPDQPPARRAANRLMLASTAATLRAAGWPVVHDVAPGMRADVENIGAYVSWGSNDTRPFPLPVYRPGRPGTFAPRALAIDLVSFNARSFSDPTRYGQSLVADLIRVGAAGAAGHVYEPTLAGVARPHLVLGAYASGVPAAEAYFRGVPYLGWTNVFVGDPLMRVQRPAPPRRDRDGDGVPDAVDDCLVLPNPEQRDTDGDGLGNLCDPDLDGSGRVEARPLGRRTDLARIRRSVALGLYIPNHDLDGDGAVDALDLGIAQLFVGLPPGPGARRPASGDGQATAATGR